MHCNKIAILGMACALGVACGFASFADEKPKSETRSDPYPLDTCIVSGEKLGSMGKPVVKEYDGREVRFCCKGCIAPFEKEKVALAKKIDARIIQQQLPHYPLKHCVVMTDDSLDGSEGEPVNLVYKNRLVRFCCHECPKEFAKNPAAYLKKIDEAVIKEQKPNYPLDTDVVTGEKLGDKAIDRVYGVTLVRFAKDDSIAKFNAEPQTYMAKLHEAWTTKNPDHKKEAPGKGDGKAGKKDPHEGHNHP